MTTFSMKAQTVQAWRVSEILEAYSKNRLEDVDGIDLIAMYMRDGKLILDQSEKTISLEVRGKMFTVAGDCWIVYNHGFFDAVTDKFFQEEFLPNFPETETDYTSFGTDELRNRFGTHKSDDASARVHSTLSEVFFELAIYLDSVIPHNRAKSLALTDLESAKHWASSGVAAADPLDEAGFTPVRKGE